MIGAFVGAMLVWLAYLPHWRETADPGAKLASSARGRRSPHRPPTALTEIIGTAVLLFGILAIAANAQSCREPGDVNLSFVFSRGLQPLLVGVLVLGHRPVARRPDRLRDQSGARSGPRLAHAVLPIAGKGRRTGATPGSPSSAPSSAASSAPALFALIGF